MGIDERGVKEMKSIIISIKPKYVKEILNGNKTLEIRKSFPKCELPCEVYIYCTKENAKYFIENKIYNAMMRGKVVAKFTLNKVDEIENDRLWETDNDFLERTRLSFGELACYLSSKKGYAWHIDNLVPFDEPKELRKFHHICKHKELDCEECVKLRIEGKLKDKPYCHYGTGIEHAPQSWCYCEVEE